jgi:hypothetical protein
MKNVNILLSDRLKEIGCDRLPTWVLPHLLPLIEAEVADVAAKADQQILRRVARVITTKSVAAAFVAGPLASAEGEGSKGEGKATLLLPTGNEGTAKRAAIHVVGHSSSTATP